MANRLEKSQPRTRRRAPTRRTARQDGLSSLQLAGLAGVAIVLLGAGLGWGGGSRASAERAGSPREAARQPLALPDLDLSPFELERQALELRTDPGHPKRRRAAQRLQALVRQRRAARTLAEEALQLRSRLPEVAESELDPAAAQARRERLRTVADELERAARLDPRDPQSSSWWRQAREAAEEARALAARVPLEAAADPESQAAEAARRFREQALLARLLTGQPATEEELRASSSAAAARRLRWLEQRRLAELSEESERLSEARRLLWSEPDRPELAAGELAACSGEARLLRLCSRAVRGLPVPQQADARLQGRLQAVRGGTVALGEAQRRLSRHAHQVRRDERYATTLQSHAERVTRLAQQRELAIWRLLLAIEADAGVGGP